MIRQRRSAKLLAVIASVSLFAAACSSDDDSGTATTAAPDTGSDTTAAPDDGDDDATDTTTAPDDGDDDGEFDLGDSPERVALPTALEAGAGVGEVGGSGCGIPHGPYDDPGAPSGEVRAAWNDPLLSFNSSTSRGNALANVIPLYLMNAGFTYYNSDLELINNDQFGVCIIESLDPLTITYRVNEGVTWSDGTQVDAADLLLTWGAVSTNYNTGELEVDDEGNPIESDEVVFDAASQSLQLVTEFPRISDDGLAVSITWDEFYVDYQVGGLGLSVPAHVVAKNALGVDDPETGKQALINAFFNTDNSRLAPIANFFNTGFDANSLPSDSDIYLGTGAYNLVSYEEVSEMVFEAREDYTWGPKPQIETIVLRIIGDPTAAVQAMQNEEIDIISPQATTDILDQLTALADRGVEVVQGEGAVYEHVDLVFDNGGPFDPATYGGDEEVARLVRQAFLLSIPRADIVERLIAPLNPDATVRNSFTQIPGSPPYDNMVANNGSDFYPIEGDVARAQELLAEAGVETPIDVRFHFADNNPRRANQYDLISASAAEAGFNVIDGRSATWGQELSTPEIYDASMFAWISTAVAIADTQANYVTGGQNNYGLYSNETVDDLYTQLTAETDPDEQQRLLVEIEQQLWNDAFGITIYQFPTLTAYNSTYVNGVTSMALSPEVFHNFWEWQAS